MGRHHDFDAAWAEADAQAPTITVGGEEITLPTAFPAEAMLLRHRYRTEGGEGGLTPPQVVELTDAILALFVGRERVDGWVADGMSLVRRSEMVEIISGLYTPEDPPEDAEGEATAPETGAGSTT